MSLADADREKQDLASLYDLLRHRRRQTRWLRRIALALLLLILSALLWQTLGWPGAG